MYDKFLVLAGLVYAVLEFLKPAYDQEKHKWNFDVVAALALGIAVTVLGEVDFLRMVGVYFSVDYVGEVLSGILVGGAVGAGLIHDFPDWVKALFGRPATNTQ